MATLDALQGELTEGVLPGVLRTLYVGRRTGLLHVTRGEERGSVCFVDGNIVYGDTNIKECHMGETLVRHGLLTQWDFERAWEMVSVTGRRLGEILVELGLLDADGLEDALALQAREVLLTIFQWREGAFRFDEQDPSLFHGYDRPLRLSTGEVILDAVWSITDPDVIRFGLGNLERVLVPASDPLLRFQRIVLNATDGFILSRVDGSSTVAQILRMAPVSAEEAQRSLFGLLHAGMVEYLAEARPEKPAPRSALRQRILDAHASLPAQRDHEVLGVSSGATPSEIQAAFVRLAKFYHPDAHHDPELADLKRVLESLFSRVTQAHRALLHPRTAARPKSRPTSVTPPSASPSASSAPPAPASLPAASHMPEPAVDPQQIEDILDRARESLDGGRYWDALARVEQVLPSALGRSRRRARVLKAEALLKGEGGRRAAEEELKAALEEDRGSAEAHFLLAKIYKAGGAHALAAASLRRVLALQPRHLEAVAELASLGGAPEKEEKKPGGLRKFFGGF